MTSSQKQGDYGMEMNLETNCQLVTESYPHLTSQKPSKGLFYFWGVQTWAGLGRFTMLTKLSHLIVNQHINSVGPQSFTLTSEKPIPILQDSCIIENSSQLDPLLIRGKTGRNQAPVLKATGMLLRPQKMQESEEPHLL